MKTYKYDNTMKW